jgi:hypothetical protein
MTTLSPSPYVDSSVDAEIADAAKTGIGINKTNASTIIITGFILQFSLFF